MFLNAIKTNPDMALFREGGGGGGYFKPTLIIFRMKKNCVPSQHRIAVRTRPPEDLSQETSYPGKNKTQFKKVACV